jgi:hypothetical protein
MIYDQVRVKEAIHSAGGCCGVNIKHNNNNNGRRGSLLLGLTHEKALSPHAPHFTKHTLCARCALHSHCIVMGGLKLLAARAGWRRCVHIKLLGCMNEGFPVLQLLPAENPFGALSLEKQALFDAFYASAQTCGILSNLAGLSSCKPQQLFFR